MIIEQKVASDMRFCISKHLLLYIEQGEDDLIEIDKTGAKQLIKVLQEFVENE